MSSLFLTSLRVDDPATVPVTLVEPPAVIVEEPLAAEDVTG
jgi:hypothetical protein